MRATPAHLLAATPVAAAAAPAWAETAGSQLLAAAGLGLAGLLGFLLAWQYRRYGRAVARLRQFAREQRNRTELLVRATQAGLLDWDPLADRVTYSVRYKEMLGFPLDTPDEALPLFRDLIHPDEQAAARQWMVSQLRDTSVRGKVQHHEPLTCRMRRADAGEISVQAEAITLRDANGWATRVICSLLDVSDRVENERALATERERLRLLVRATKAGFTDWDLRRRSVDYSGRFKQMLGYPADAETAGWPSLHSRMPLTDARRVRRLIVEGLRRRHDRGVHRLGDSVAFRLVRRDGTPIWVQADTIAQVDAGGRVRRLITSYVDITHLREQEAALQASRDQIAAQAQLLATQNEALKENVRLREEVERIGRHDLKTPLHSIVTVPRLLREGRQLGPEADELLETVERAGLRVLSMVNLSLDLFKMEQGSYVLRPAAVDLAALVRNVLADVRLHAESKQVVLDLAFAEAPLAWGEEPLCYSLLANLVKNAVEAAHEGSAVRVALFSGEDGVEVHIHNAGEVPPPVQARFFSKYVTAGKGDGTGLGAYSARLLARVQGGDVEMRTGAAEGTTLRVRLPRAPSGAMPVAAPGGAEASAPLQVPEAALRVLLVDDDEYHLLVARRMLAGTPLEVETAINGRAALSAAERHWPDLLFMDLDMPVLGGLDAVEKLRELQRSRLLPACRMVALTSHDDEATRQQALSRGFDDYVVKPLTRATLQAAITAAQARAGTLALEPELAELLPGFLASRRRLIADAVVAAEAEDRAEVRRIAHKLSGSFALFGLPWAAERCRWLDRQAQSVEREEVGNWAGELRAHLDALAARAGAGRGG